MTAPAVAIGSACVAFSPVLAVFSLVIYQKSQLVIVVTTAAFFFLLASVTAAALWSIFDVAGLKGPLAAIVPGVFFQFVFRCLFVALYHRVERVIQLSLQKQHEEEQEAIQQERAQQRQQDPSDWSVGPDRELQRNLLSEVAKLRLELNDASCGVAAGVGFGGMHAILLFGTLLASQSQDTVGILYQDSCPSVPFLVVSAMYTFYFSVLDIFWMLFTFFGMRRRLLYHRGGHATNDFRVVGGLLGNSRMGGNLALLLTMSTHFFASLLTTSNYFKSGCIFSLTTVGILVLVTAYLFWAGVGRIYMPPVIHPAVRQEINEPPFSAGHVGARQID